jgi:hypothetical protein
MAAKAAPPVSVSIATVAGLQVSELVLWATLIYTVLMIAHKVYTICNDIAEKRRLSAYREKNEERRNGNPDTREIRVERRAP